MRLKTASDFLKDIGFSKYLAVLDSRVLGFFQDISLVPKEFKSRQTLYQKGILQVRVYWECSC